MDFYYGSNVMSKLFKLKEWLTLDEAAEHLTVVLGESVLEKDIYRLALDGYLQLSINIINGTQVHKGKIISPEEVEWQEFSSSLLPNITEKPVLIPDSLCIDENRFLKLEEKVKSIRGVWDLMMIGGERLDIEHWYQQLIEGPAITLTSLDGAFVQKGNVVCQLLESFEENEYQTGSLAREKNMEAFIAQNELSSDEIKEIRQKFKLEREEFLKEQKSKTDEQNYYPAAGLPSEGVLVVRTKAIMDFINSLNEGAEKPLSTKERHTLLVIIAALCKEIGIDYTQRGVASAIQLLTENIGSPITDDTIRNILKQINEAVDVRSK